MECLTFHLRSEFGMVYLFEERNPLKQGLKQVKVQGSGFKVQGLKPALLSLHDSR